MSASSIVRRRSAGAVSCRRMERIPALSRRFVTKAEDRARVETELARARAARSPYADYLAALLESPDPQVTHAEYVAGLEAEVAALRARLTEVSR